MPVVQNRERVEFDRAPVIITIKIGKQTLDLTAQGVIQIELVVAKQSTWKKRGTDDELTWFTNGTDGKLSYNPPAAGWSKNVQFVVWLDTEGVRKRHPENGELEIRVRTVGSEAPPVPE